MPEPFHSVLVFFLDLCCTVAKDEQINKMPPTNIATCIAPNLFTPSPTDADSFATLIYSQKVVKFLKLAIDYRLANPPVVPPASNSHLSNASSPSTSSHATSSHGNPYYAPSGYMGQGNGTGPGVPGQGGGGINTVPVHLGNQTGVYGSDMRRS